MLGFIIYDVKTQIAVLCHKFVVFVELQARSFFPNAKISLTIMIKPISKHPVQGTGSIWGTSLFSVQCTAPTSVEGWKKAQ